MSSCIDVLKVKAETGDKDSMYALGLCLVSAEWLVKAARAGSIEAQQYLGDMWEYIFSIEQDKEYADKWIWYVRTNCHHVPYRLGLCFYHGIGVTQDYEIASQYWEGLCPKGY